MFSQGDRVYLDPLDVSGVVVKVEPVLQRLSMTVGNSIVGAKFSEVSFLYKLPLTIEELNAMEAGALALLDQNALTSDFPPFVHIPSTRFGFRVTRRWKRVGNSVAFDHDGCVHARYRGPLWDTYLKLSDALRDKLTYG